VAGFTPALANSFGTAPRTLTAVRSPSQKNVDAVFMKNFRLGESKTAQVKFEMLNLFNRVTLRGDNVTNTFGSSTFERWGTQSGFARITQIMLRFSF